MRVFNIVLRNVEYGHVEVEAETMQEAIDAAMKSPEVDWEDPAGAIPYEVCMIGERK